MISLLIRDISLSQHFLRTFCSSYKPAAGDGHTYYTLFRMLSSDTEVTALNPTRKPSFFESLADALGVAVDPLLQMASLRSTQWNTWWLKHFGGAPRLFTMLVDHEAIEELKAQVCCLFAG
jgi:hypothetical protein